MKALEEVAAKGVEKGGRGEKVVGVVEGEGVELEGKGMGAGEDFLKGWKGLGGVGGGREGVGLMADG